MATIQRRIEKAEKAVGVQAETLPPIVVRLNGGADERFMPQFSEPEEEWVTQRDALQDVKPGELPPVLEVCPFAEYETRHGLEPGTLTGHPLCGKVPFADLLEAATGSAPEQEQEAYEDSDGPREKG